VEAGGSGEDEAEPVKRVVPPLHVTIIAVDRTNSSERPADMSAAVQGLAEAAAKRAGFTVVEDGHSGTAEVFYAVVKDGKPDPKAERGTVAWGVSVMVRVEDEQGLGEVFEGRRGDERPFIKATVPDLKAAFDSLLGEALEGAFRDVAMQIKYVSADAKTCEAALTAQHPEERWAALRRLGDLGSKESAQPIIDILDGADELTTAIAVGVLARLKSARAVPVLAKLAEGPSPDRATLIVNALAEIGGPEARKYLELIGASHPNEVIRKLVSDLLAAQEDKQ